MGKKLNEAEKAIFAILNESMDKLSSGRHDNDQYEFGYAQALSDIRQIILSLK